MILDHHYNLVQALRQNNTVRAAFEAAWMSHAIVDGLTPAHHYPLSDKIEELWGRPKEERLTVLDKNFIHGTTGLDTINKNWEYWGAKGVFATHILCPSPEWVAEAEQLGLETVFLRAVQRVYALDMYHTFWRNGWTTGLALQTRNELIPEIIRTVTFAWYSALCEAYPL